VAENYSIPEAMTISALTGTRGNLGVGPAELAADVAVGLAGP
jgi:hypothetical protein